MIDLLRELSRLKYGKPRELVEAEIAKRSKLFEVFGDLGPGDNDPFGGGEGSLGGGGNQGGLI